MLLQKIIQMLKSFFGFAHQSNNQTESTEHFEDQSSETLSHHDGRVTYSADLISDLKDDHQHLLEMYISIQMLLQEKKYGGVVSRLTEFKEAFNRHLMSENVKFYAYLNQNFDEDSIENQTVSAYRKDMNKIAYTVVKFLKKWTQNEKISDETLSVFMDEYNEIAGALTQRIHDEENELYVLYKAA